MGGGAQSTLDEGVGGRSGHRAARPSIGRRYQSIVDGSAYSRPCYGCTRHERNLEADAAQSRPSGKGFVSTKQSLVSVVDDDESIRESLPAMLGVHGFPAEAFPSAEAFLASTPGGRTQCLVLDVNMPGMSGPELQRELSRSGAGIPIIFITAHVDDSLRLELLAQGAVECLFKPFTESDLLAALRKALRTSR